MPDDKTAAMHSAPDHARHPEQDATGWPLELYRVLKQANIRQVAYVPDAGHSQLIRLFHADPEVRATVLTSEEEGVAIAAGCWLGGQRTVLLMQSSGVGNCINTLSLMANCRFPLLMIVTMRGEWAEFNPWQIPMGMATEESLRAIGVRPIRVERTEDIAPVAASSAVLAFDSDQAIAVLISHRALGAKTW